MAFYHHNTIENYVAALLSVFNDFEIQYQLTNGTTISRKIPIRYSTKEKSTELDRYTLEQLTSGNYNVLPRGNISLVTMAKAEQRTTNKKMKIGTRKTEESFEFLYNSVPYEFTFQLDIMCRGMTEATQLIEQIAPKFNPVLQIDVWDADNLDEPTRIPVKLLDIAIEAEEYEEYSTNIITVACGIAIMGNLYPPIKSIERIKDYKIYINETDNDKFSRKSILGWDVDTELTNEEITTVQESTDYPPVIIDIVGDNLVVGDNELTCIYEDKDNKLTELSFNWSIISGNASISYDYDIGTLTVNSAGDVEVLVELTDIHGNSTSASKIFTI